MFDNHRRKKEEADLRRKSEEDIRRANIDEMRKIMEKGVEKLLERQAWVDMIHLFPGTFQDYKNTYSQIYHPGELTTIPTFTTNKGILITRREYLIYDGVKANCPFKVEESILEKLLKSNTNGIFSYDEYYQQGKANAILDYYESCYYRFDNKRFRETIGIDYQGGQRLNLVAIVNAIPVFDHESKCVYDAYYGLPVGVMTAENKDYYEVLRDNSLRHKITSNSGINCAASNKDLHTSSSTDGAFYTSMMG